MLSRLKFTARSTIIYSIGSVGTRLIGLILLPLYTDRLTTEQYGMWSLLEITSQIFVIAVGLRMSTAMLRFYSGEKDKGKRSTIVFTAFWVTLLSVLVFNLLTHPLKYYLSDLFFDTREFSGYFTLLFIWTSFEVFNRIVLDLLRVKEKPVFYITVTITKFVFVLFLNIYFIIGRGMGIEGIILGQLLGSVVLFLITLPLMIREMKWSLDKVLFREMFKYSLPLILSGLATFMLSASDRYLVKIYLDYHEVGLYSISYKISNVLKIVLIQAFQLGFLPIAFNMFDKKDSKRFFSKVLTYYVFILCWAGLAISLFSREILYLFSSNPAYYSAYIYIPLITLAVCFYGIQNFFVIGLHYAKKTQNIAVIVLLAMFVSIGSNMVLIPRIGLWGAAISFVVASLVMLLLNFFRSQKYYPVNYETRKIAIIFFIAVGLYLASRLGSEWALGYRLTMKLFIILGFPFLLYLFNFFDQVEIERIVGAWKKWRKPRYWYKNLKELSKKQSMDGSDV